MKVTRETHIKEWQSIVKEAIETPNQDWYIRFEGRTRTEAFETNFNMQRAWLWLKDEAKYHDCIVLNDISTVEFFNGSQITVTVKHENEEFPTGIVYDVVRKLPLPNWNKKEYRTGRVSKI